jgi:alpha-beta hydrolase superfamily lysophospholipase
VTVGAGAIEERALWFGPPARPLFGWLVSPADGKARGGVVLAPPVGREARGARRALRGTAIGLAERGFVALRFDYFGTGDSAGDLDAEHLDHAWTDSVASAVELLRSCELEDVAVVGMRLGATIVGAAAIANDLALSALVLWDPCDSGRNYLRELSALEALRREHVDLEEDGSVETAEFVFSASAVEAIRGLRLSTLEERPLATRVLVLSRPDRPILDRLRARLEQEHVEWAFADDQAALVDVDPLHAAMPVRSMQRVVDWLASRAAPSTPFKAPPSAQDSVVFADGATPVAEHSVRLGPHELFGIVSEPTVRSDGPLVVFLNVSIEEHTGPSRLWVELARRWAAAGLECVRFDLTGLGDSPWLPGTTGPSMYDQRWIADMTDVAASLRPKDPSDVVFVGLCSGAFLAVEAGLALSSRGVCAINPPVGIDFLHGTTQLGAKRSATSRALAAWLKEVALRLRWVSVAALHVLRFVLPSMYGVDSLGRVASNGTDLLVLSSTDDLSPSSTSHRFDRFFSKRLLDPRGYEVNFVPGLDHSMHAAIGRRRAIALLDEHVLERFAPNGRDHTDDDKERG